LSHYNRGSEVCPEAEGRIGEIDKAVLAAIAGDALKPELLEEVVAAAHEAFEASARPDECERCQRELAAVEREQMISFRFFYSALARPRVQLETAGLPRGASHWAWQPCKSTRFRLGLGGLE
jgi:hypothetical protein